MRAFVLITLLAIATPAAAHEPALLALLRAPDVAVSEASVRGRGPALIAIARDATLDRYARMRAASALALVDTPEVRRALAELAEGRTTDDVEVRIQALAALTHLEKQRATPRLTRMLHSPNPELRAAAARNLARLEGPEPSK